VIDGEGCPPPATLLSAARRFIGDHSFGPAQRTILERALEEWRPRLDHPGARLPAAHLPLLAYAGVHGGTEGEATELAVRMLLLDIGITLLDHVVDEELTVHWDGYRPQEVELAATSLVVLAPLSVHELDAPAEARSAMAATLARFLVRAFGGEQWDLALQGRGDKRLDDALALASAKTGERGAAYAAVGGQLAGAPPEIVQAYSEFGHAYGMARSISADCFDLFSKDRSHDLVNGTITVPIALGLAHATGEQHGRLVRLLEDARTRTEAQDEARRELLALRVPLRSAFIVEMHCQRALDSLQRASPRQPARSVLEEMIIDASFGRRGI
jgi:hypothetical protein